MTLKEITMVKNCYFHLFKLTLLPDDLVSMSQAAVRQAPVFFGWHVNFFCGQVLSISFQIHVFAKNSLQFMLFCALNDFLFALQLTMDGHCAHSHRFQCFFFNPLILLILTSACLL